MLCGGAVELDQGRLRDAGRSRLRARDGYFECLHELKLIVDLIYEGGIANMNYSISNNAEYGEYVTGPRHHRGDTKAMRRCSKDIQTGEYAKSFIREPRRRPTLQSAAA